MLLSKGIQGFQPVEEGQCLWWRASRVCGRASCACGSAMQAETEAGCVESNESVASFSVSATIIEEK